MKRSQIVAVVVLYKRPPEQSQTINGLAEIFAGNPALLESIQVLIWDNSPRPVKHLELSFPCEYRHSERNVGTSGAFNHGLEFAEALGSPWLLLLDQDTTISPEYLPRMLEYSYLLAEQREIGTVVPYIYSRGSLVSPRNLGRFNHNSQISPPFSGVSRRKAFAVNSATLMRVEALREIGGYSEDFWLDLSDVYVFDAMYRKRRYVYVAADLTLQHSLTSSDFDNDMAPERYRNFLAAESAYVDLYSTAPERAVHILRLLGRTYRQRRRYRNVIFSKMTFEYLRRRLFDSRTKRIKNCREQLVRRDLPVIEEGQVVG